MSNIQSILKQIATIVKREMDMNYRLFLFGSRAGGTNNPKADIDIGILADKPIPPTIMANIKEEVENITTLLKIDFVDFSTVSPEFRKIALKEIKEIYI
jgi:uncharacterized protein